MASSEINRKRAELQTTLEKDEKIRCQLSQVYTEIKDFFESHPDECLEAEILPRFPEYKESLNKYPSDLHDDTRPLVFTGEISSGKSTLINALLGFDVLPTGSLATTGVVCRIISSEKKNVKIFHKHEGKTEPSIIHIDINTEEELREKLETVVSPQEGRKETNVEYVDIYWPIPFLPRTIIMVDTPGVGESDEMTKRVLDYLPKAVGLIYVIDPDHGGGLAQDRIVPIIECQMTAVTEDVKATFDPSCALFVCNKWDQVKQNGVKNETKVYEYVKRELKKMLPNFEENQLHCISALKVIKNRKKGKPISKEYEGFENAVLDLIERSVYAESRLHIRWLKKFLDHLQLCVNSHLKGASLTYVQKNQQLKEVRELLQQLIQRRNESKDKLQKKVIDACEKSSKMLQEHVNNMKTRDVIFSWENIKHPEDGINFDCIKMKAFRTIQEEVAMELVNIFIQRGHLIMQNLNDELKEERNAFDKAKQRIADILLAEDASEERATEIVSERKRKNKSLPTHKRSEYLSIPVAILTAPVWLPLFLVACSIVLIGAGVVKSKEKIQVMFYKMHRIKYMNEWSREFLDLYGENMTNKIVTKAFKELRDDIQNFFYRDLIKISEAYSVLISNLHQEGRTAEQIVELYNPMFIKIREIQENFINLDQYC